MADAGMFIGWGAIVRGREAEAGELFGEMVGYLGRLAEEGEIESFEPVFLQPHGGDLEGFFLLRGEAEKLAHLRLDEDFTRMVLRATLIADNVGVIGADIGARLEQSFARWSEHIAAFA